MLVSIITPVTGNPLMKQAIQSVQDQDYPHIEHLIVIDGQEREAAAQAILQEIEFKKPQTHVLCLPYATGKDGFNGHRIYGMSPFLAKGDYLAFLDEDNWFEPNHISSLVQLVEEKQLDWAYALRKIVNSDGSFATYDNCESLGKWQVFYNNHHLIDTNCYFLKKRIALQHAHQLYMRHGEPTNEPDTVSIKSSAIILCNELLKTYPHCDTPGFYTVNYRVGMSKFSVKLEFFHQGNAAMQTKYPQGFPWQKEFLIEGHTQLVSNAVQDNSFVPALSALQISLADFENNSKVTAFKDSTQAIVDSLGLENPYINFNYQDYALDLQGWGSNDPLFNQLIDQIKPKVIIEVGTWKGASAVHMAKLLQEKHIDGTIICVDTWLGGLRLLTGQNAVSLSRKHGYPTIYYQFLANIMYNNLHDSIVPLSLPSATAAHWLQQKDFKADLIYIDAGHEEDDVYADMTQYWELLKPNGIIFGDDYADLRYIGLMVAVHKFTKEHNLTLKSAGNKWWLQKPADPQEVISALNRRISQLEMMLLNRDVELISSKIITNS
ncbi:MAG: class I SAM-dependent methyltransferase [Desmonostoc vinosum HA7617-LM4]|jgi:glycosyltransferase involved in cell wall biosynthesis|nr:class I SAM-dependent methyltransferase [Desmonostoc vinosum HA7617-LM4]